MDVPLVSQISLPNQLSNFKDMKRSLHQKLGEKVSKKLLGRAVYFFSIGGNDYINLFTQQPKAPKSYKRQYVAMVIRNLTSVLKVRTSTMLQCTLDFLCELIHLCIDRKCMS